MIAIEQRKQRKADAIAAFAAKAQATRRTGVKYGGGGESEAGKAAREADQSRRSLESPLPVTPNVNDGIGRAKAIAEQAAGLDSGDVLSTNQGNVPNIIDFARQNEDFEKRMRNIRPPTVDLPTSPNRFSTSTAPSPTSNPEDTSLLSGILETLKKLDSRVATGGTFTA